MIIVHRWRLAENVYLEADSTVITVVITVAGQDGDTEVRATVTNMADMSVSALQAAAWMHAVYPPASPGRPDLECHPAMRARAWDALMVAGESLPGEELVTEFLRDHQCQQDGGEDIERYAVTWRRLRYAC